MPSPAAPLGSGGKVTGGFGPDFDKAIFGGRGDGKIFGILAGGTRGGASTAGAGGVRFRTKRDLLLLRDLGFFLDGPFTRRLAKEALQCPP